LRGSAVDSSRTSAEHHFIGDYDLLPKGHNRPNMTYMTYSAKNEFKIEKLIEKSFQVCYNNLTRYLNQRFRTGPENIET